MVRTSLIVGLALVVMAIPAAYAEQSTTDMTPKSEIHALRLSLLSTLVPCFTASGIALTYDSDKDNDGVLTAATIIFTTGAVFGPTTGFFYARRSGRGLVGMGVRLAVVGGAVAGSIAVNEGSSGMDAGIGTAMVLTGGATLCFALAVIDISRVDNAVRSYNQSLGRQPSSWGLSPAYFPAQRAVGASLQLRF